MKVKFRCWDIDKKQWLEESEVYKQVENQARWNPEVGKYFILRQSTNIYDKTDKEIFEGNIVNSWEGLTLVGPQGHGQYWRTVVRDKEEPRLRFEPATGFTLCKNNQKHFKIIGNIDENPELLK